MEPIQIKYHGGKLVKYPIRTIHDPEEYEFPSDKWASVDLKPVKNRMEYGDIPWYKNSDGQTIELKYVEAFESVEYIVIPEGVQFFYCEFLNAEEIHTPSTLRLLVCNPCSYVHRLKWLMENNDLIVKFMDRRTTNSERNNRGDAIILYDATIKNNNSIIFKELKFAESD